MHCSFEFKQRFKVTIISLFDGAAMSRFRKTTVTMRKKIPGVNDYLAVPEKSWTVWDDLGHIPTENQ